jgi:hypothetical protein
MCELTTKNCKEQKKNRAGGRGVVVIFLFVLLFFPVVGWAGAGCIILLVY